VEDWSVVQVIVTEEDVMDVAVTAVITGADVELVVKVALAEVARVPAELAERAA
jgi:hypothetical protein